METKIVCYEPYFGPIQNLRYNGKTVIVQKIIREINGDENLYDGTDIMGYQIESKVAYFDMIPFIKTENIPKEEYTGLVRLLREKDFPTPIRFS